MSQEKVQTDTVVIQIALCGSAPKFVHIHLLVTWSIAMWSTLMWSTCHEINSHRMSWSQDQFYISNDVKSCPISMMFAP